MNINKIRSQYADYISAGIRYALIESGLKQWPESTVIIAPLLTSDLALIDSLLGFKVIVSDIPTSFDFHLAFESDEVSSYKLLTYFTEYCELNSIGD